MGLASCTKCIAGKLNENSIISESDDVYLAYPYFSGSITDFHLILSTKEHINSSAGVDEEVYDQIRNYMKSIVTFNLNKKMSTVFLEYAQSYSKMGHFEIEAIPIKEKYLDEMKMYYKKAFLDEDEEWSENKKIIDTTSVKGNLSKILNEKFSYVSVDFNAQGGFLHIVQDERSFSAISLKEILSPMLKKQVHEIKYPKKISLNELFQVRENYKKCFEQVDWTNLNKY